MKRHFPITLLVILGLLFASFQPAALASPSPDIAAAPAEPIPAWAQTGPSPSAQTEAVLLHLRVGSFDPLAGEPVAPAGLRRTLALGEPGLRLVQFPGPIQDAWYQAMQDAGLEVVTYIPEYAYLVWGDAAAVNRLADRAPLRWAGVYQPYYALHPALFDADRLPAEVDVIVQVYQRPGADQVVEAVLKEALDVFRPPYPVLAYTNLGVRVPAVQLAALAALPGVVDVEPYSRPEMLDELQNQIMAGILNGDGTQPAGPGYLAWLSSLGFSTDPSDYPIVDITDDGIDDGDATPIHADFYVLGSTSNPDRLVYNYNWTTDPLADGGGGHGNINASIAVGYNNRTGFPYEDSNGYNYGLGVNPFGRVAGSKVFKNAGAWDTSATPTQLIQNTYSLGGRISSNSWGYLYQGGNYNADCQEYDARVRDAQPGVPGNQEITVVFSAGNAGSSANSVSPPGTAKNVISVGAAENYRPQDMDGCDIGPTGANNAQDIAFFSSRGPCDDSRVKPDLVAPGTHVMGAASQSPNFNGKSVCGGPNNDGALPPDDAYYPSGQTLYTWSSGTSHSAPAVAGAASLVYYWYRTRYGNGQWPSPAMVKAYLTNATRYLTGSGAGGNLPSNSQGYGETLLGMAFDNTPRVVVDQSEVFGQSGQVYELQATVADPSRPLRVTLAWSDPPGPTTGAAYINNLNLEVVIGGQTYRGNVFSGPTSVPGGTADPRNNVESVFLPAGQSGMFTVRVIATNIAGDGVPGNGDPTDQDFALLIYNGLREMGYLNGTVSDGTLGGGLPGATVQAVTGTVVYRLTTGASGYYTGPLAADTYTVSAWKYGYTLDTVTGVDIVSGTVTTQDFTLYQTAPYSLTGCVTDAATAAPLAATLKVYGPFGDLIAQTQAPQSTGCYSLTLYGGPYTVTAEARLHVTGRAFVDLVTHTVQHFALTATTTDGILWGYITNLQSGLPVEGAAVQVTPGAYNTTSASGGYYELQLPYGTYTVTVSAPLYSTVQEGGVVVPQSNLVRRDYALPTAHMVLLPPEGLSATLRVGKQVTQTLVISNSGVGVLDFEIAEKDGGRTLLAVNAAADVLVVNDHLNQQPVDAVENALTALGYSYDEVSATSFVAMTIDALLAYGGVIYVGYPGSGGEENQCMAYLDAGGNMLVTDNDFGYYRNGSTIYQTYFQATYVSDNGSDGVITGMDIMDGVVVDISVDPYPDDFTARPEGVGIFAAPSGNLAGIRVERAGYRAIYLAWDYDNIGADGPGDPGEVTVMERAMGWLMNRDIPWLSTDIVSGTVAAGSELPVALRFDASVVTETGVYVGWLQIKTNDPEAQPYASYPLTLTVLPPLPELSVAKSASAPQVEVGMPLVYTITVTNDGGGPAAGTRITDTLPANTLFAWASHGGTLVGDRIVWSGLTVPARGALSVAYGVTVGCVPSATLIVNDDYTVTATDWPTPTTGLPVTVTAKNEGVSADFSYGPLPVLVNRAVSFSNLSHNATEYAWSFGDGGTSTAANPAHTYSGRGARTVVLTASNLCNTAVVSRELQVEDYTFALVPDASTLGGNPGQRVTYTLRLTNTGTLADVYDLTRGSTPWTTSFSTTTVQLDAGEGAVVEVYVTVPANAAGGAQASVQITARSQNDPRTPAASAAVVLTTRANNVYRVALGATVVEQTVGPGAMVTYTLRVTNTGNVVDTIAISRVGSGWPTAFSANNLSIAAGGYRTVRVYITVPSTATADLPDVAVIRATGSGGYAEVVLTTRVSSYRAYVPLVLRDAP